MEGLLLLGPDTDWLPSGPEDELPTPRARHQCTAGEREEGPEEEHPTTTSPPVSTSGSTPHTMESADPVWTDHPQLETNNPSDATREGTSGNDPGERTAPVTPYSPAAATTSWPEEKEDEGSWLPDCKT